MLRAGQAGPEREHRRVPVAAAGEPGRQDPPDRPRDGRGVPLEPVLHRRPDRHRLEGVGPRRPQPVPLHPPCRRERGPRGGRPWHALHRRRGVGHVGRDQRLPRRRELRVAVLRGPVPAQRLPERLAGHKRMRHAAGRRAEQRGVLPLAPLQRLEIDPRRPGRAGGHGGGDLPGAPVSGRLRRRPLLRRLSQRLARIGAHRRGLRADARAPVRRDRRAHRGRRTRPRRGLPRARQRRHGAYPAAPSRGRGGECGARRLRLGTAKPGGRGPARPVLARGLVRPRRRRPFVRVGLRGRDHLVGARTAPRLPRGGRLHRLGDGPRPLRDGDEAGDRERAAGRGPDDPHPRALNRCPRRCRRAVPAPRRHRRPRSGREYAVGPVARHAGPREPHPPRRLPRRWPRVRVCPRGPRRGRRALLLPRDRLGARRDGPDGHRRVGLVPRRRRRHPERHRGGDGIRGSARRDGTGRDLRRREAPSGVKRGPPVSVGEGARSPRGGRRLRLRRAAPVHGAHLPRGSPHRGRRMVRDGRRAGARRGRVARRRGPDGLAGVRRPRRPIVRHVRPPLRADRGRRRPPRGPARRQRRVRDRE